MKDKSLTREERDAARVSAETRRQEIARRAYELWEQDGCPNGNADAHWSEAERQLRGAASLMEMPHENANRQGAPGRPQR